MKNTMRKIHLYSGLSLLGFMVMYFLSGFMIFEGKLFPSSDPDRRTQMLQVEIPAGLDLDQTGAWLAEHYELGGKPQPPRTFDNGKVRYAFNRPGIAIQATLDSGRDRVEIITTRGDYRNTMVGYHRMRGYGANFVWNLWTVMYDLASLGCIVFALSGIWIWATARERDRTSWVMFILGWGMTIGMIMYLMLAR